MQAEYVNRIEMSANKIIENIPRSQLYQNLGRHTPSVSKKRVTLTFQKVNNF
jgi:hypothetical protein